MSEIPVNDASLEEIVVGSADVLELNLLHIAWAFRFDPLRLNKSGAPNRRSLIRHARGVVMPGLRREIGDAVDLADSEQLDYLAFLLALAIELGLLVISPEKDELCTDLGGVEKFFDASEGTRTRRIYDALSRLRLWNELSSHAFLEPQGRDDEHLSLLAPTGERLIGARGAVFSVLKRLESESEWVAIEELAHASRDRADDYLNRVFEDDVAILGFVHAIIRRALAWTGLVDIARDERSRTVFRLNDRGRVAFGLAAESTPGGPTSHKSLIVQPNLEITVMLDAAPLSVLHKIYRIAERRSLADRVATFALSARTVQRGYANGADAEEVTALLDHNGLTPLPDSIRFQLQDWERVHRRVAVYADGVLFRHHDPDQLDLIVGQLRHDNQHVEFVRLGPSTTFAASVQLEGLRRVLKRDHGINIDYLGHVPPSITFVAPLEITIDPIQVDIITLWELDFLTTEISSARAERRLRLDPERIRERYGKHGFRRVIEFLEPRTIGGLPPAQYLKLRSLLDSPTRASLLRDITVLVIDSVEDAERVAKAPEIAEFMLRRLGPRTFSIDPEREHELLDVLQEVGIRGGSASE